MKNILLLLLFSSLLFHCARQSQPGGGPTDKEPPKLGPSIPRNGEKNYKGKTIELTFDEYVKLKDPQDEIVITPPVGSKTKFLAKKNKVIITPEKPWKDSTTYSISFRGSVQDINESNTAEDLRLAFSTGSSIDSLQIFGSVTQLFKEQRPEKITVALYQSDTFDIFKHKPVYIAKTNKRGVFSIQNLKPAKYFVYAFEDKNKNFKVDSKSEKFGFLSKEISLPENKDSVRINLIRVDTKRIKVTSIKNTNSISTIRFNKQLDKIRIQPDSSNFLYTYGDNHDEVIVYKNFNQKDSLQLNISAYDSVQQELDTTVYVKYEENKKIEEKLKLSEWRSTYDPDTKLFETTSKFNKLLRSIAYDSMYIQIDTANYQLIKPENVKFDTLNKTVTIKTKLNIEEKEHMPHPVLLFGKGTFVSLDNDSTKSLDLKINLITTTETGSLSLEIQTTQPHFEVQLVDATGKIARSVRDQKKITFKYLLPSEYKIQVIEDSNNNHRWDAGSYPRRVEPEKVILYKNSENKFSVPIRANWEVGPLVITF
jgi:uncharacterized protein (DUF2141 family)